MWVFMQKFIMIYVLLIWFWTCKDWWNKAIIVPLGMLIYQLIKLLNDEIFLTDELQDAQFVVPFTVLICAILFFIRKKLSFSARAIDLKKEIEQEITQIEKELHGGNI